MFSTRLIPAASIAFVCGGALCLAQSTGETTSAVFHIRTDLVALDIAVESPDGDPIPPLTATDFVVLEDNAPQRVTVFSHDERAPLSVALLIDHSQSMAGERLERAKAAASTFLNGLTPNDVAEVITFNEGANRICPLGADHAAAVRSIADLSAGGRTGLYDALLVAIRDLERAQRESPVEYRKAIVILSDGDDTASHQSFEDVLEDARRSSSVIHAVSLRTDPRNQWLAPSYQLTQLALDTGGRAVAIRNLTDLGLIYERLATEMREQYRLGYVSSSNLADGTWRRIVVRTTHGSLVARTRSGYYAPRR